MTETPRTDPERIARYPGLVTLPEWPERLAWKMEEERQVLRERALEAIEESSHARITPEQFRRWAAVRPLRVRP